MELRGVTHVGVTGSAFDLSRFIVVLVVCCKTMTFRSATVGTMLGI